MKKTLFIFVFALSVFSLSAQHFYLGLKSGLGVNNGFNRDVSTVAQNWNIRSQHYFSAQTGIIARYETPGFFKMQLEVLHSNEGNNFFFTYKNSSTPDKEYNVQFKRSYIRINLLPQFGGSLTKDSRWRFMGGIGISEGVYLSHSPTYASSDSLAYWPINNTLMNTNSSFGLLFSASISWKLGIGVLEFNPRFRYSLTPSFETHNFSLPEQFNRAIELNISFVVPIKLDREGH